MEIREGIRYEYALGKFAKVVQSLSNPKKFQGLFEEDNTMSSEYSPGEWRKDFKSGSLKLIEYPYKVGDWVYGIDNPYPKYRAQITKITKIDNAGIWCLDLNESETYLSIQKFNKLYRPAFTKEIPNYEQKVVKENYDYLIPILTELNTT